MANCHPGGDHSLPYENLPGGMQWESIESFMADQIVVKAGVMDTVLGRLPTLVFKFSSTDDKVFPDIVFVGDERVMRETSLLVQSCTQMAIQASA